MRILIVKQNQAFFKKLLPKIKFKEETENTTSFGISPQNFEKLQKKIRETGNNPFSVMAW